jgi:hypothetical protein
MTTIKEQSKKEEWLTHRTATIKIFTHAFGTYHCCTFHRDSKAMARAKPTRNVQ